MGPPAQKTSLPSVAFSPPPCCSICCDLTPLHTAQALGHGWCDQVWTLDSRGPIWAPSPEIKNHYKGAIWSCKLGSWGSLIDLEKKTSVFRGYDMLHFTKIATAIFLVAHAQPEPSHSPIRQSVFSLFLKLVGSGIASEESHGVTSMARWQKEIRLSLALSLSLSQHTQLWIPATVMQWSSGYVQRLCEKLTAPAIHQQPASAVRCEWVRLQMIPAPGLLAAQAKTSGVEMSYTHWALPVAQIYK